MSGLEQDNQDLTDNMQQLLEKINNLNIKLEDVLDDKLRYENLASEKTQACEKLGHTNQKLMIKLASALCELDRVFIKMYGDQEQEPKEQKKTVSRRNLNTALATSQHKITTSSVTTEHSITNIKVHTEKHGHSHNEEGHEHNHVVKTFAKK